MVTPQSPPYLTSWQGPVGSLLRTLERVRKSRLVSPQIKAPSTTTSRPGSIDLVQEQAPATARFSESAAPTIGMRTRSEQRLALERREAPALLAEDEDRRAGIVEAMELGRPVGRGADDAAAMAAEPVPEAAVVRPDERLPEQRPHRGADDRGSKGSIRDPTRMNPAPPMASEVRIRVPRFPAERTASSTTQQRPARGEAPCNGDHRWATMAPTPEARGVVETSAEGLGRDAERRGARPAAVADQLAGDGDDEELFAGDERLDVEAVLDGLDDVPHALDEEHLARIPVARSVWSRLISSSVERASG